MSKNMNASGSCGKYGCKTELRRAVGLRRARQDAASVLKNSLLAQRHILASPEWKEASHVGLYVAMPGELLTGFLLWSAWKGAKKVWLPKVTDRAAGRMRFAACPRPLQLRKGAFGIYEPSEACWLEDEGAALDILFMPGVAFDMEGHRLGFGGGFYDRYLGGHAAAPEVKIGLCFSFQIVRHVPHDAWDCPVDGLCSERGLQWL